MLIALTGPREGIDGEWYVTRAEHKLDSAGYVTTIEAEVPK